METILSAILTELQAIRTLLEIKKREKIKKSEVLFDFHEAYKLYPRKEGKTPGIRILATNVKNQEDFELLIEAIKNYGAICRKEAREKKFILHFATFAGRWRDYIPADNPTRPQPIRSLMI